MAYSYRYQLLGAGNETIQHVIGSTYEPSRTKGHGTSFRVLERDLMQCRNVFFFLSFLLYIF